MNKYKVSRTESKTVLEIQEITNEQVIFKVKDLTNLEIAQNPMFNKQMDYITVTRGKDQTLTVINKDGTTFSFYWGSSGHTLISTSLKALKQYVLNFAKANHIMLKHTSNNISDVRPFYNDMLNKYQLTVVSDHGESDYLYFDTEEELREYYDGFGFITFEEIPLIK